MPAERFNRFVSGMLGQAGAVALAALGAGAIIVAGLIACGVGS